tara:strand:+ start:19 stop:804 length:786 start_codon:yes stop_codon:yes gene_type:complete
MKIFDCFMYHNEDLMLDIRLNTLSKYVDQFILVEAMYDHQGNKKKLNFRYDNFKSYKDKITYLVIEKFPDNMSCWDRENYQRNYIMNGLEKADLDDYILISDVDEIPDLAKFELIKNFKYSVFKQKMYYYKINLLNKTEPIWYGSKICKKRYIRSPQWLRDQKIKKASSWKFFKEKWNVIEDGGWHFSFLMSASKIKEKLNSYAHSEYNDNKFKNLDKINYAISKKIDLFDRSISFEKTLFDDTFPEYILNNKEKFKNWIL